MVGRNEELEKFVVVDGDGCIFHVCGGVFYDEIQIYRCISGETFDTFVIMGSNVLVFSVLKVSNR